MQVHAANVQDRDGAKPLLASLDEARFPRLTTAFADPGHRGRSEDRAAEEQGLELRIIPKLEGQNTFVVSPKRWVVERAFAWLMRCRRLRADHGTEPVSSRGWILVAAIHRMVRRLVP